MGLSLDDLDAAWMVGLCRDLVKADSLEDIQVRSSSLTELDGAQGVISRYEKSTREAIVGHRVLTIRWVMQGKELEHRVVIKSKAPGSVIRRRLADVYGRLDPRLAALQQEVSPSILDDCHTRELQIYELDRPGLRSITPVIERVWMNPASQIFVIVMELLEDVRHEKTLDDLDVWLSSDVECVLDQIARVHGEFLGQLSAAAPPACLVPFHHLNNARLLAYQGALLRYNAESFPDLFDSRRVGLIESFLTSASERHRRIMDRPLTLVHGDFTPRNVCLKESDDRSELRLCAYDWELAQVHLPQRDICEFLCYVLNPKRGWKDPATAQVLDRYRSALEVASGRRIEAAEFRHDLAIAIEEFCSFKLLVQGVTHQLLGNRHYFERLVQNSFDSIEAFPGACSERRH